MLVLVVSIFGGLSLCPSTTAAGTGGKQSGLARLANLVEQASWLEAADTAASLFRQYPSDDEVASAAFNATMAAADGLREQGRLEEAVGLYGMARNYDLGSYLPFFRTGAIRAGQGRWKDAEAALGRAAELSDEPVVTWSLANVLYAQGKFDRAIPLYRKVLDRGKDDPSLMMNLGMCFWRTGDNSQALYFLKQALARRPGDAGIERAIAKIEKENGVQAGYRTVERGDFSISFERGEEQARIRRKMTELLRKALDDVEHELWRHECGKIQVVLYPGGKSYEQATDAPNWSGACWDGKLRIPVETARDADEDHLLPILRHELVHFLIRDRYKWMKVPGWLDEGMAQLYEGRDKRWASNLLRGIVNRRDARRYLFDLRRLEPGFSAIASGNSARVAYAEALWMVKYLLDLRWSNPRDVLDYISRGYQPEEALDKATGKDYEEFMADWIGWLRARFHLSRR